jgi:hypothetical protein
VIINRFCILLTCKKTTATFFCDTSVRTTKAFYNLHENISHASVSDVRPRQLVCGLLSFRCDPRQIIS